MRVYYYFVDSLLDSDFSHLILVLLESMIKKNYNIVPTDNQQGLKFKDYLQFLLGVM